MDQHRAFIASQKQLRKLQKENAELRHLNAYLTAEGNVLRREYPDRFQTCQAFCNLLDTLRRLLAKTRSERDDARRQYCRAFVDLFTDRYEEMTLEDAAACVATDFGWDCFSDGKEAKDGEALPE